MTEEIPEFKLSESETHSACWMRLKPFIENKLAEARSMNDADLSIEETMRLRGKIQAFKNLLAVGITDNPAPMADYGA